MSMKVSVGIDYEKKKIRYNSYFGTYSFSLELVSLFTDYPWTEWCVFVSTVLYRKVLYKNNNNNIKKRKEDVVSYFWV